MTRVVTFRRPSGLGLIGAVVAGCAAGPGPVSSPSAAPAGSASTGAIPLEELGARMKSLSVTPSAHNLIKNATFDGSSTLPWMTSFTKPGAGEASLQGGAYCMQVTDPGKDVWSAQFRHREMVIQKGHKYSIRFKIAATVPTTAVAQIGMSGPPYRPYWRKVVELGAEPQTIASELHMASADDATAEFAFQFGGQGAAKRLPFSVCVDDVILEDPEFTPKSVPVPPPVPNVLVNQLGYLPSFQKIAILKSDAKSPLAWELQDRAGRTVAHGATTVHGADAASGDHVHAIDFSSVVTPGAGYTLHVGGEVSHPFAIDAAVYQKLKYDALAYFYQTRSGIPIAMPYAGDPKWVRGAGHPGDKNIPCAPDAGCDYSLDVSGGWYDAGDFGKYVVSGAIAAWTLLDQYERAKSLGSSLADFGDGKMNIPENHNGVPDLLDEARWELEFLMKMQVPDGRPFSGMAHHKIHDNAWTALGTRPDDNPAPRFLRPVSTAATLDLAAVGAACARIWKVIDPAFARRCLRSAERAWTAAIANPSRLIPSSDTVGGGAYDDPDVSDEFYWAAAELFATTQKQDYREALAKSRHYLTLPASIDTNVASAFRWDDVAALGTISLAVAPGALPPKDLAIARAALVKAADAFVAIDAAEGYRVGFRSVYHWGSNSPILDNAITLGLAYDFTKDPKYADAAENVLGYILGRNPMDQSYVTGFGFRPLQNPHHRFWAHQASAAFPEPPPGVLSGGPNQDLQDPYGLAAGLRGCPPMKCFVDHIEAYSANEEAINWNAALAWVAAFLDERGADSANSGRGGAVAKAR
jgi:endoglucanase